MGKPGTLGSVVLTWESRPWDWPGLCGQWQDLAKPPSAPGGSDPLGCWGGDSSHTLRGSGHWAPEPPGQGGPVEAGLWLMNEGRSGGAVALEGSLLEGSKPRGEEGTAPAPGVPPILTSGGSGGGWHPWPSVLRPEAGQGVRMSDFPWNLSRCPVSLAREARRAWSLFRPAFHSLRSSSPGCRCRDWLLAVPPLQPTFPHGKQEAGLACPHRIE